MIMFLPVKVKYFNATLRQRQAAGNEKTIDFFAVIVHSRKVKGAVCAVSILLALVMMPLAGFDNIFFPPAVQGWTLAAAAENYAPENLYLYIDGASELYISYGFNGLVTRKYEKPGLPEIVVDFFDMGSPANAFGIFAHSQERPDREIGQDSEYLDGLLRFWKGRYYVSLQCSPETPESRAAVLELGRRLAAQIQVAGERPVVLELLPGPGLLPSTIRFFHHHAWQNTYTFISTDNIMGIGPGSQAVLAKYAQDEQRPVMLLILYPNQAAAGDAFAALRRKFSLPAGGAGTVMLEDGKYFAACLEGNTVAAVWNGGGPGGALALLAAVREKILSFKGSSETKEEHDEKKGHQPT
jgi:hypothetical protein